jgi:hypothetical protein
MMLSARSYGWLLLLGALLAPAVAHATKPKLDRDTCSQLRAEEKKFRQSGILNDMSKGPQWAKANLSAERLRDVRHYIELDEQVQFGCRDAKPSVDAAKASAAAARIELNSDADPTVPLVKDPAKPGNPAANPHAKTKKTQPKSTHKKGKTGDPKSGTLEQPQKPKAASISAPPAAKRSAAAGDGTTERSSAFSGDGELPQPVFGFGETVVLPHSAP